MVSDRIGLYHGAYGPQQGAVAYISGGVVKYRNKGVKRAIQAEKRREAEIRNARTPLENRRAYREGRMRTTPEVAKTKQKKVKK